MRKFANRGMDGRYQSLLMCPPIQWIKHKQMYYRLTGAGMYFPFWVGYDNPNALPAAVKGTPSYASWAAGVDYRRAGGRDYPKT